MGGNGLHLERLRWPGTEATARRCHPVAYIGKRTIRGMHTDMGKAASLKALKAIKEESRLADSLQSRSFPPYRVRAISAEGRRRARTAPWRNLRQ
jgi:hypothetical protein